MSPALSDLNRFDFGFVPHPTRSSSILGFNCSVPLEIGADSFRLGIFFDCWLVSHIWSLQRHIASKVTFGGNTHHFM
jgi:hypothetical protein